MQVLAACGLSDIAVQLTQQLAPVITLIVVVIISRCRCVSISACTVTTCMSRSTGLGARVCRDSMNDNRSSITQLHVMCHACVKQSVITSSLQVVTILQLALLC